MKNIINISVIVCVIISLYSCTDMEDIYKEYVVPGGITYPQKPMKPMAYSGDSRIMLKWSKGNDPSIVKATVSWDNGAQMKEFAIDGNKKDIEIILEGLEEKDYFFTVRTFDAKGNGSVPIELNSLAYGESYKSSIYNRTFEMAYVDVEKLVVEWNPADISNGMVYTELYYLNKAGEKQTLEIDAKFNDKCVIDDYKLGTDISHKSFFIPDTTCVDVFETQIDKTVPSTILDRSDWTITASSYEETAQMPNGGDPKFVLDGLPTYWHSLHSSSQPGYPHWLAVDMKKQVNIKRVVLQCRNDGNSKRYSFKNFTILGSQDGVAWKELETYDVYTREDPKPQYYPVYTKETFRHFKILMNAGYEFFADLSELSILGIEKE